MLVVCILREFPISRTFYYLISDRKYQPRWNSLHFSNVVNVTFALILLTAYIYQSKDTPNFNQSDLRKIHNPVTELTTLLASTYSYSSVSSVVGTNERTNANVALAGKRFVVTQRNASHSGVKQKKKEKKMATRV